MRSIAVYRHQLFKHSEPFIHQQALHVPGFRPIFVGRERLGEGPVGAVSTAMTDVPHLGGLFPRALHAMTRSPRPMARLLRSHDVALVHAHFGLDAVYAARLAGSLNIPLVTTCHGMDVTVDRLNRSHLRSPAWINYCLFRRNLFERGAQFLCVSEFIRQRALALGFPEERTRVHYIGVDTSSILPSSARSSHPTVLHVARLVEKKGTSDLLRAFVKVLKQFPETELQIIGEGPLKAKLMMQAESLGVGRSVTFLGAMGHSDVLDAMARAWVFCLPSVTAKDGDSEGLPIVVLEAAATGTPVVSTRHAGTPEAVLDGVTGLLARERDADAIADHLCTLIRSSALREQMGVSARHRAESKFDVVRQSASLSEIYRGLL